MRFTGWTVSSLEVAPMAEAVNWHLHRFKEATRSQLYAQRHAFMFGKPDIRHKDPRIIKVPH